MFNSNGEPMFYDLEFFNTYDEKIPKGMNRKTIFYELPYWEHLKISHLLDPMHILKIGSSYLWWNILSLKIGMFVVRGDLISSNTKKKHCPRQGIRVEDDNYLSFKKGDVPWILKKNDVNLEKEVILGMKAPSFYGYSL